MKFSKIIHDEERKEFRMMVNNHVAKVEYIIKKKKLYLVHSQVHYSLRGRGAGRHLVEKTFEYIESHNLKAVAVCSFIKMVADSSLK